MARPGTSAGKLARRALSAALVALAAFLVAGPLMARGSVRVAQTSVTEDDGEWTLKFTIDYGGEPHMPHIPMRFSFKQTSIFERYTDDTTGDKPATRTVPVQNAVPIDLPMDVGFSDMSGKTFKITKFKMPLTRDAGFEAGEYSLTVRLVSGGTMGGTIRIRLNGNNKVINRKAITFEAPPPKEKPKSDNKPEESGPTKPRAAEEYGPDLDDIPDVAPGEDPDAPPAVPPKQGGCGCVLVGGEAQPNSTWLSLLALGALWTLRRRR